MFIRTLCLVLSLLISGPLWAWSNHTLVAYRALERMPEVANAPTVTVEPLAAFLRAEDQALEALLAGQEAWAAAHIADYPQRPAALAFSANPQRSDDARRLAFLMALRVAPNSRFALYAQPDPRAPRPNAPALPFAAVDTLPEPPHSTITFIALKPGDKVDALTVLASACDEPDYGLDINLWSDSPSDWGKVYGFGPLPFGNPALSYSTQAPFHMGFFHESSLLYKAAPFLTRTYPELRFYQFSSLAELAFRTGHDYWGWRFTGMALHYLEDLTQPYHASLAPGVSTAHLLGVNLLSILGLPGMKDDTVVLLSNRHLALEKYQLERLTENARNRSDSALERALHDSAKDASYPDWSSSYLRDVVSAQAAGYGAQLAQILVSAMPPGYVSDPRFDFGAKESGIELTSQMGPADAPARLRLETMVAELLGNFGAHSRNAVRGILKAASNP